MVEEKGNGRTNKKGRNELVESYPPFQNRKLRIKALGAIFPAYSLNELRDINENLYYELVAHQKRRKIPPFIIVDRVWLEKYGRINYE